MEIGNSRWETWNSCLRMASPICNLRKITFRSLMHNIALLSGCHLTNVTQCDVTLPGVVSDRLVTEHGHTSVMAELMLI